MEANILSRGEDGNKLEVGILCGVSHKDHFACTLNEVACVSIVSNCLSIDKLPKLPKIVCFASDQVIELPVKHPELFEALGIDQPKVRLD